MDSSTIARWRMRNLKLWRSDKRTPHEVIATLAASQGQDFLPGLWSIAQRTSPVMSYDDTVAAFDRGDLLRTHVLRPTWHLVAPADLGWLLTATAPRVHKLNAYYYRQLGVDEAAARKVRAVLERILPGRALTREEIGAELGASGEPARLPDDVGGAGAAGSAAGHEPAISRRTRLLTSGLLSTSRTARLRCSSSRSATSPRVALRRSRISPAGPASP